MPWRNGAGILYDSGHPGSSLCSCSLKALFGKVGSFRPLRENFRLTPKVKAQFTSKLEAEPRPATDWIFH